MSTPAAELDTAKVAAARLWATTRLPYLASALFACTVHAAPDSGTVGIERGWRISADPRIVGRLSVEQLGRLLLHLTAHAIRDHATRAERVGVAADDARGRWNRATDAEINDDLEPARCVPRVARDLPAELGCEPGQLAEHYYERGREGRRRWDCGPGADGRPSPGGDGLNAEQAALVRLGVAAEIQRSAGREPGTVAAGWLRWAESVLPSRTDWRRLLAAEVRSALASISGNADYTYRRPSRRAHVLPDVILPALHRPVPDVAIVCDTSGSMHERLLARALAEVEGILTRAGLRSRQVRVLSTDTEVHAVRRVSRADQVELLGGGGTDMGAGLTAAYELRPRPSLVVVLTDGYTPWPPEPPRGQRVVVGLLAEGLSETPWPPPDWARSIVIPDE